MHIDPGVCMTGDGIYQLQGLSTERKSNALWFAHFIMGSGTTQMSAVSSIIHRDAVTSSLISLRYGTRFYLPSL